MARPMSVVAVLLAVVLLVCRCYSAQDLKCSPSPIVPTPLAGPVVDANMTLSLLSSSDDSNITFTLSFNVSHGPPSRIICTSNNTVVINTSDPLPNVVRKVIRSHYVNSSQPDMTRVIVTLSASREERTYTCNVTVEGCVNISGGRFNIDPKGNRTSTVSITGKCVQCVTAVIDCTAHY